MRHLALFLLFTAACDGPGISEDTALDDLDTTEADTDADSTDNDGDSDADTERDTTEVGDPIESTALTNKTYVIDYDDVTWVAPSGAGLLSSQIPVEYILMHIIEADAQGETIDAAGALGVSDGSGVAQDPCQDAFLFGSQDFSTNPLFNVGPTVMSFPVSGSNVNIENASVEALFVEGGDAIIDISIAGSLDTRPLDASSPVGDICAAAGFIGATCTACEDGAVECLDVFLTVPRAEADDSIDFDPDLIPGPSCR